MDFVAGYCAVSLWKRHLSRDEQLAGIAEMLVVLLVDYMGKLVD